jgi:hypothetical protein
MLLAAIVKACALLTAAEIAAVQGEKPVRPRETPGASRCVFALPTAAKSVSVEVTRGAQAASFADHLRLAAAEEGEEAGGHDTPAVERVEGMGDEAFWALGIPAGSLYVRQGATLLRIVVGGDESKEAKLGKLRLLVPKALARLPKFCAPAGNRRE